MAANIAERAADGMFAEGQVETLLDWEDKLRPTSQRSGKLLMVCAMIRQVRYEYYDAEALLAEAASVVRRTQDSFGQDRIEFEYAMLDQQRGRLQDAIARAQNLLASTQFDKFRGSALNVLGLAYLDLGNVPAATESFERALPFYNAHMDANARAKLYLNLGVACDRAGNLRQARAYLQQAIALLRALGSETALGFALNNLGFYFYLSADPRQARATFEEGLSLVTGTLDKRTEAYLLWSLGDVERDIGLKTSAFQRYSKALEHVGDSDPFLRASILISLALLERWEGKLNEAAVTVTEVLQSSVVQNIAIPYQVARALKSTCETELGHKVQALSELDSSIEVLTRLGARLKLLFVLTLATSTALSTSGRRVARRYFTQALALAQELDSPQYLVAECANFVPLRTFMETSFKDHPLTHMLLQELSAQEIVRNEQPISDTAHSTQSLTIVTLGQISVSCDGETLSPRAWQAISAQELFLYLLFEGPADKDRIALDFWPDMEPQQVRNNFHTSLHRAREAVGENVIIFSNGKYLINRLVRVRCDVFDLSTFVAKAALMAPQDARAEDLFTKAANLYQGEFLPGIHMTWVTSHRRRAYETYIEALIGLSRCRLAWKDYHAAAEHLRRALHLEPYREDIHRKLLHCYAAAGERQRLIAHYEATCRLFERDLKTEPAPETSDLYYSLLK
jgi:DNA-binding SARP family transcriptional activator/Flp pilus assembly protein TadD